MERAGREAAAALACLRRLSFCFLSRCKVLLRARLGARPQKVKRMMDRQGVG